MSYNVNYVLIFPATMQYRIQNQNKNQCQNNINICFTRILEATKRLKTPSILGEGGDGPIGPVTQRMVVHAILSLIVSWVFILFARNYNTSWTSFYHLLASEVSMRRGGGEDCWFQRRLTYSLKFIMSQANYSVENLQITRVCMFVILAKRIKLDIQTLYPAQIKAT